MQNGYKMFNDTERKNEIRLGTKDSMCSSELGFDLSVPYSVQLTWF